MHQRIFQIRLRACYKRLDERIEGESAHSHNSFTKPAIYFHDRVIAGDHPRLWDSHGRFVDRVSIMQERQQGRWTILYSMRFDPEAGVLLTMWNIEP
jgi:hypothetical protein